jgi:CheY-like chemotaxis protein
MHRRVPIGRQMMQRKSTVLFIADSEADLAARKYQLESFGFCVMAASGHAGLEVFKSQPIDAVVVDESAERDSGADCTAAIKRLKPRVPIVILADSEQVAENVRSRVDAMVLKAQPEMLSERLNSLIRIRSHSHPQLEHKYVVFSDVSRRYQDCSDGVCELLGYSRMELTRMTIDDVSFRPQKAPDLFEEYVSHGQMDGQYILRHKNGRLVFIQFQSQVFPDGCMAAVWEPVEDWKQLYQSAMLEFDPDKLKDRLELAQHAVEDRMNALTQSSVKDPAERQQLQDALSGLRVLMREFTK